MRFLVLIEAHGAVVGKEADRALREAVGPQIQQLMQSGKVVEAGFMTDRRGSFFLLDIDAADELYSLLGPEITGISRCRPPRSHPSNVGRSSFMNGARPGVDRGARRVLGVRGAPRGCAMHGSARDTPALRWCGSDVPMPSSRAPRRARHARDRRFGARSSIA